MLGTVSAQQSTQQMAAVIMVVTPVNGPMVIDHIAELNCGFGLAEQGIRSSPIHLSPGIPHSSW